MTVTYTKQYTMTYREATELALELTKESIKPFGFKIMELAGVKYGIKSFENGLDYEIGIKFVALVKSYKGTGKRPKSVTFAFHKDGVDILSASGMKYI